MMQWMTAVVFATTVLFVPQETGKSQESPPTSQPGREREQAQTTKRESGQVEIIRKLLQQGSREEAILPQRLEPEGARRVSDGSQATENTPELLLEGTILFDRPGRLILAAEQVEFVFHDDGRGVLRTMEINKNSHLETMERLAQAGNDVFRISAQVTRYRDKNYLNILRVTRTVRSGNLGP